MTYIDESELGPDPEPLGTGGTADILKYRADRRTGLYKRYKPDQLSRMDGAALARLVEWRAGLPDDVRRPLDEMCAWPTAVVRRGRQTVGVLMPPTPAAFAATGRSPFRQRQPTLANLRRSRPDLTRGEILPATVEALAAFGLTARAMLWLHDLDVIVNDVQPLNVLVNPDLGRVHLLDCDSMLGPAWGRVWPPAAPSNFNELIPDPPSPAVDLAKLAWCMIFVLLEDFSLRGLGPDVRRRLGRYLPEHTVDLLVRTAMREVDVARLRIPWQEGASQWITCAPQGVLITDSGWLPVTTERVVPQRTRPTVLPPTVPRQPQPVTQPQTVSADQAVSGYRTGRARTAAATRPTVMTPSTARAAGRARTRRRVQPVLVALAFVMAVLAVVLAGIQIF